MVRSKVASREQFRSLKRKEIVMASIMVAGEQYYELDGQLSEIKRQLRQSNGYPFNPLQLKAHLQAAIEGRFGAVIGNFKRDMRKGGLDWTLLENVPRRISSVIDAIPFLTSGENSVKGDVMATRAVELDANYGQEDAEWLLEHQDMISAELRNYYLVFPATKWRSPGDLRKVPYLYWSGGRWHLFFDWLGIDFNDFNRLVRPRK